MHRTLDLNQTSKKVYGKCPSDLQPGSHVAGLRAGEHVQLPSPVAAHVFLFMQPFKRPRAPELSEHVQSHCLCGVWPVFLLFFLPLHHMFCMQQSVASVSPLSSADIRYASEAWWDPSKMSKARSKATCRA